MAYANGRIPLTALTTIDGIQLLNSAAAGYKLWKKISELEGVKIAPARPVYGSGYRDIATQIIYKKASQGDKAAMARVGLNTASAVRVADPGYSVHGDGKRLDVTWSGSTSPTGAELELAARYGWVQEFKSADENHMAFDGKSHTPSSEDKNRIVCRWLNGKNLGVTSNTDQDGVWPVKSNFSLMLQKQGHKDGKYPTPQFIIDGEAGHRTEWLREYYFTQLWNS